MASDMLTSSDDIFPDKHLVDLIISDLGVVRRINFDMVLIGSRGLTSNH